MKILVLLILFAATSCYSQNSTTVRFVNRTSSDIDSIVIRGEEKVLLGKLIAGQQYSEEIRAAKGNGYSFTVYLNGREFTSNAGFSGPGLPVPRKEEFYVFENGISTTDKALQKPKEFKLYFYNASSHAVDSFINENGAIVKVNETTPRSFELVYDFGKVEASKDFTVAIGGKTWRSDIDHDFGNWNHNQAYFHFENDSLKNGVLPWREPLEFIVDLLVHVPLPSDSVKVESGAIVKTYYFQQPNFLRVVFDFQKLKQDPLFIVTGAGDRYRVDLNHRQFLNMHSFQKIFYLEKNGIRSLGD